MPLAWETGSASTRLACVAALIKPHLVMSAKQRQYHCSGPLLRQVSFEFPFKLTGKLTFFCV